MRRRTVLASLAAGAVGVHRAAASSEAVASSGAARAADTSRGAESDTGRTGTRDATREAYGPVGSVTIPDAREAVVAGDTAFVATGDGYTVVDLTDPTEPAVIADRSGLRPPEVDQPFRFVWDVSYDDDRLLVPAQGRRGEHTLGFALEDVSDRTNPTTIRTVRTDHSIHNGVLSGDRAYVTGGGASDAFTIYDARRGDRLGSWSLFDAAPNYTFAYESGPSAHDLSVAQFGTRHVAAVACWDAGTWLVDVTDPTTPTALGRAGGFGPLELAQLSDDERDRQGTIPPGNHHNAQFATETERLFVGRESWAVETDEGVVGGPSGVVSFDVSDRTAPERLGSVEPVASPDLTRSGVVTTAHNFAVHDGTFYSSWYRDGVKRHDVTEPGSPALETHWRDPATASFWAARVHRPGETFLGVASPFTPSDATSDVPGGVYLFPDEPGRAVAPFEPSTPSATERDRVTPGSEPTDRTTEGGSATDPSTAVETPGFGVLAGATAVGLAAWRRASRSDE